MSTAFANELRACAAQAYPEVAPRSILGLRYPSWEELIAMAERGEITSWADLGVQEGQDVWRDVFGMPVLVGFADG